MFSPVILFGWNDTQNFSYGRAYSCALRCTGANAISLSLNKEMAKENQLKGLMPLRNPQDLLLSSPAARGGYAASDAVTEYMSFSCYSLKSGTDRGDPRGNVLASFLATFWDAPRSGIQNRHTERAQLCEAVETGVPTLAKLKKSTRKE